ncbi:hypothetical protein KY363_03210 [Candidatus Woesearchaeota archaeon]|nr:hypothetical protein [Candidatus Woesearchaeota archaeon]
MTYNDKAIERDYDTESVRKGALLVGNEGLVPSSDFDRRYTSRGVEDSGVLSDSLPGYPIRDFLGTLASYSARGKLPPNW